MLRHLRAFAFTIIALALVAPAHANAYSIGQASTTLSFFTTNPDIAATYSYGAPSATGTFTVGPAFSYDVGPAYTLEDSGAVKTAFPGGTAGVDNEDLVAWTFENLNDTRPESLTVELITSVFSESSSQSGLDYTQVLCEAQFYTDQVSPYQYSESFTDATNTRFEEWQQTWDSGPFGPGQGYYANDFDTPGLASSQADYDGFLDICIPAGQSCVLYQSASSIGYSSTSTPSPSAFSPFLIGVLGLGRRARKSKSVSPNNRPR